MTKLIKPMRAHENEIVRIMWYFIDGTTFEQDVTAPPKATREARQDKGETKP